MQPGPPHSERFHALDSLRAFAMLLGVLLHAAISFITINTPWAVRDVHTNGLFDVFVGLVHCFRMQLFFLLAGFFARLLYQRLGPVAFAKHRFKRIGIPFLVGMVTLMPLAILLWIYGRKLSPVPPLEPEFDPDPTLLSLPTGHLWFLYYLLIYYVVALAIVPIGCRLVSAKALVRLDIWFARFFDARSKPFLLAVPTTLILSLSPQWAEIELPGVDLTPTLRGLAYYGLFFSFGWWLHRQPRLLDRAGRFLGMHLLVVLPAFGVFGGLLTTQEDITGPAYALRKGVCCLGHATCTWAMIFVMLGVFLKWFNRHSEQIRYLADSAYWVYLVHLPVVVYLQIQVAAWDASPFLKFAMVNAAALAFLYATYHTLVRYTFIGAILNGPRRRPATAPQPNPA